MTWCGENNASCTKNIAGTFTISKHECKKIFIDYNEVFNLQPFCEEVIISAEEYESPPNDHVTITNVKIEGDCLILKYVASGCDESAWVVKLMDAGIVAESYPVQRTLRLSLENKEMCSAYIGKETSFDRSKLQVQGNDKVSLPIADQNIYMNI